MCLLMASKGARIPDSVLTASNKTNSDGYGLAYYNPTKQKTVIHKTMDFEYFKRQLTQIPLNTCFIAHMRLATKGSSTKANCHPFRLNKFLALAHNGHLAGFGHETLSDTADFARILGHYCQISNLDKPTNFEMDLCRSVCGGHSKIAILCPTGIYLVNEDHGEWDDAKQVWYSVPSLNPDHKALAGYTYIYSGRNVCTVPLCWADAKAPGQTCTTCDSGKGPVTSDQYWSARKAKDAADNLKLSKENRKFFQSHYANYRNNYSQLNFTPSTKPKLLTAPNGQPLDTMTQTDIDKEIRPQVVRENDLIDYYSED